MDKDNLLKEKLIKFLEELGIDVTYKRFTSNNVMIRCPFAKVSGHAKQYDNNPSFGLRLSNNGFYYNCFTCGRRGRSIIQFVDALVKEGVIAKKITGYELQNSIKSRFPKYTETVEDNEEALYVKNVDGIDYDNRKIFTYNRKRGLNKKTIRIAKIGYLKKYSSVIFPVYDYNNVLRGYVYHRIDGRLPRYKNKLDTSNVFYLEWLIQGTKGIIVEGIYDALITYQHLRQLKLLNEYSVISTFGTSFSTQHLRLLVHYFDTLIIYTDNDIAGIKMEKKLIKFLRKKLPSMYSIEYEGKDPAEVNRNDFYHLLKSIKPAGTLSNISMKY